MENDGEEKKKEILQELLADERHSLEDLKRLVSKSKEFIRIESSSGEVIVSPKYPFITIEKTILYLIGLFFSKELGYIDSESATSRQISENIQIAQTTLSGPLGELVAKKILHKNGSYYFIKYYNIETQLDYLQKKYLQNQTSAETKEIKKPTQAKATKKSYKIRKAKTTAPKQPDNRETQKHDPDKYQELLKYYQMSNEDIETVFSIHSDTTIIQRGFKSENLIEEHLRASLLALIFNHLYYNTNLIESKILRKWLKDSGVENLTPLSSNLKKFPSLIIHRRGPRGSTRTDYKITNEGIKKGIQLIKDIINNTNEFQVEIPYKSNKIKKQVAPTIQINKEDLEKNISAFCQKNNLDEDKLRQFFDLQTDNVRILVDLEEKTRKELQINALMLLGVLVKEIYFIDSFDGKKLLKESHIPYDRLDLLNSNKKYKTYFAKRPKSAMELTYAGQKKSKQLLSELIHQYANENKNRY